MQYFISVVQEIGAGISSSLLLFVLTLIFSMPLGLLVCFGRMSKIKPLSMVFNFVISVLRGTPLMLQLVVVFFGPYYVFGMNVSNTWRFWAAIVGFSINYAAYFAEIYRSGIQAIPKGQYEAAEVLGYTKTQTFWHLFWHMRRCLRWQSRLQRLMHPLHRCLLQVCSITCSTMWLHLLWSVWSASSHITSKEEGIS